MAKTAPSGFTRSKYFPIQWQKCAPVFIVGVFLIWSVSALLHRGEGRGGFAVGEFGQLPIVANGRIQPMDSLGRNSLLQLREKQTADLEPWKGRGENPTKLLATEWLMGMMMTPDLANDWPVFRIDHSDLKGLLQLPANADPEQKTDGKHFSWALIMPKLQDLQREAVRAGEVESPRRSSYEEAVVQLWGKVGLYMRLQNMLQPQNARNWERELEEFLVHADAGVAAIIARQEGRPHDAAALEKVLPDLERFDVMTRLDLPLIIPPPKDGDEWMSTVDALIESARGEAPPPGLRAYARMAAAYRAGDAGSFNEVLRAYRSELRSDLQPALKKAAYEHLFNRFAPFYKALAIYGFAFVCALGFWCAPQRLEWLRRSAVWLVLLALFIHSAGLLFRMALEGRPPVTNLYSSAVFVGWGACVLGLILERFWRNSMGVVVSSTIGFLTLIVAHHLSLSGDTMEMVRAVLDTNFWLATHVVVITLGYASTFVAGFLGMIYVLRGVCTRSLDAATGKSLAKMVYGIICFATLFSFVGTLLGGIWADQSWGRFWGWDPKENGALIIVLWNALILHARWGGLVRDRGLVNLAIMGNVATAWSWFGVNMLGIGLHSYGFMDAGFRWLMLFVGSQILLVALGLLPPRLWRSDHCLQPGDCLR